jgi:hypothetical protein
MFPHIYETVYGDGSPDSDFTCQDAKLNSMVLRHVVRNLHSEDNQSAEPQLGWRVRIADRHDNEDTPHWVLDFGNVPADPDNVAEATSHLDERHEIVTDYCDNHSDGNGILQAMGQVTVTVWAESKAGRNSYHVCTDISKFYCSEALPVCFPSYFINIFHYPVKRPTTLADAFK